MGAIVSPLLEFPIDQAAGVIFNIVGGLDMSLTEASLLTPRFFFFIIIAGGALSWHRENKARQFSAATSMHARH